MPDPNPPASRPAVFDDAAWYDRGINWPARLAREIPVLAEVFGPPGRGGILDAGCGTGRQACALAGLGYRMVGADLSTPMLDVARAAARESGSAVRWVASDYGDLEERTGGGFDGLYCIGNALAAAGSREKASAALAQFGRCLRPRGRMLLQVLNFPRMRRESPCVRGPRVARTAGIEYLSTRVFCFEPQVVRVTNVTLWHDSGWQCRSHAGTLYPVSLEELRRWCGACGLRIDRTWGGYHREPFSAERSGDLLLVATRTPGGAGPA